MSWKSIALVLLLCGISAAQQAIPKHIRVSVQFIEVPHPILTELLAGESTNGHVLHAKTFALVKDGKAKLLETCMVVCRSGHKATTESIAEFIYPTEYNPPGGDLSSLAPVPKPPLLRPEAFTAFETRNTGVTFEIEPTLNEGDQIVDLRFVPEMVSLARLDTVMEHRDEWGDASLRMPVFETIRTKSSITLVTGKFELASVVTPKPIAPGPTLSRKILVFVRADIVSIPLPP